MEFNKKFTLSMLSRGMADENYVIFEDAVKFKPASKDLNGNPDLPKTFSTRQGKLVLYDKPDYSLPTHEACRLIFGNVRQLLNAILHFTPPTEQKDSERDYYSSPGNKYASYAGFAKLNFFFPQKRVSPGKELFPEEIIEMGISVDEYLKGCYENSVISQIVKPEEKVEKNQNANSLVKDIYFDINAIYSAKNISNNQPVVIPESLQFWSQRKSIVDEQLSSISAIHSREVLAPKASRNSSQSLPRPKVELGRHSPGKSYSINSISSKNSALRRRTTSASCSNADSDSEEVDSELLIEDDLPLLCGKLSSKDDNNTNDFSSSSLMEAASLSLKSAENEENTRKIISDWIEGVRHSELSDSLLESSQKKEDPGPGINRSNVEQYQPLSEKPNSPFIRQDISSMSDSLSSTYSNQVQHILNNPSSASNDNQLDYSRVTDTYAIKDKPLTYNEGDALTLSSANTFYSLANMRLSNIQVSQPADTVKSCLKSSSDTNSRNELSEKKRVHLKLPKIRDTSNTLANLTLATEDISLMDSSSMSDEQIILSNFPDRNQNHNTGNSGCSSVTELLLDEQNTSHLGENQSDERFGYQLDNPSIDYQTELLRSILFDENRENSLKSSKSSINSLDKKSLRSSLSSCSVNPPALVPHIPPYLSSKLTRPVTLEPIESSISELQQSSKKSNVSKAKSKRRKSTLSKQESKKASVKKSDHNPNNMQDKKSPRKTPKIIHPPNILPVEEIKLLNEEPIKTEVDGGTLGLKREKYKKGEERKAELEFELMKLKNEEELAQQLESDIHQQISRLEEIVKDKWLDVRILSFEEKRISMVKRLEEYLRRRSLKSNEERARLEREGDTNALLDFEDKEKEYEEFLEDRLEKQIDDSRLTFLEMSEEEEAEWLQNEIEAKQEATSRINDYLTEIYSSIQAIQEELYQHSALTEKENPIRLWEEQRRGRPLANIFTVEEGLLYYYKLKAKICSIYERKFHLVKGSVAQKLPKGPFNPNLIESFKKLTSQRKKYLQMNSVSRPQQLNSNIDLSNNSSVKRHLVKNFASLNIVSKKDQHYLNKEAAFLSHKRLISKPWVFSYGVPWRRHSCENDSKTYKDEVHGKMKLRK